MICPNCSAEHKEEDLFCGECGIRLKSILKSHELEIVNDQVESLEVDPVNDQMEAEPAPVPACQVCGRQDETLRVVVFPYVVSLVIITFRRYFAGVWCKKHQNRYLFLASLITSTIGWIGIPFGFIYSPVALFKLAKGGPAPNETNAKLLTDLAEYKQTQGDYQGSKKCLEESLKFQEDKNHQILSKVKRLDSSFEENGKLRIILTTLLLLILSLMGIGLGIGLLNYLITYILGPILAAEGSILSVIISWVPLFALMFFGGLLLFQLVEWAIRRMSIKNTLASVAISVIAALFAAYAILQGTIMTEFTAYALFFREPLPGIDLLSSYLYIILLGGVEYFFGAIYNEWVGSTIYLVIFAVISIYYLGFSIQRAIATANWQRKLAQ